MCKDRGVLVRRVCDLDELSDMEDLKALGSFYVLQEPFVKAARKLTRFPQISQRGLVHASSIRGLGTSIPFLQAACAGAVCVVMVSTCGHGDFPQNAGLFWSSLSAQNLAAKARSHVCMKC